MSSLLDQRSRGDVMEVGMRQILETILELVRRIDTLNTEEHRRTRQMIVNARHSKHPADGVAIITAEVELLAVSDDQEMRLQQIVNEEIISALAYPEMTFRYERIVEAYPTTFEWAFRDPTADQLPWSNFSHWLEAGSGVYWVNGKAGSGKSTLMKHIFDAERTRRCLKTWASTSETDGGSDTPLCFATFFFWNSGTQEQKSQTGLIRSLLYQVLRTYPDLVPVIFPDAWATAYTGAIKRIPFSLSRYLTLKRLMSAFRALIHQTRVPLKLCLLVDGLDEFEGSHEEMADLFQEITEACHVKVCLSSRPWVIFSESFKTCPSLRLQNLTRPDITRYVVGKFEKSKAFSTLRIREPESAPRLITEIIEKADGVFLWVQIVVDSLLKGIQNRDDIGILHQRLRCMPRELEPLYRHLLSLIEPVYLPWASKAFQLDRAYRSFHTDGNWPWVPRFDDTGFTISQLHLAITESLGVCVKPDDGVRVVEQISPTISHDLTDETLPLKCEDTKVHLTARCAGLLEVPEFEQRGPGADIEFLHRTARDFIEGQQNWLEVMDHTSGTSFDPNISILRASVLRLTIKCSEQHITSDGAGKLDGGVCKLANCVLFHAYWNNFHGIKHENGTAILEDMVKVMTTWDSVRKSSEKSSKVYKRRHWTARLIEQMDVPTDWKFVALATIFGLNNYVEEKLAERGSPRIASRLLHVLLPTKEWNIWLYVPEARPEMVSLLLSHHANPDLKFGKPPNESSAWSNSNLGFPIDSPICNLLQTARRERKAMDESTSGEKGHRSRKKRKAR